MAIAEFGERFEWVFLPKLTKNSLLAAGTVIAIATSVGYSSEIINYFIKPPGSKNTALKIGISPSITADYSETSTTKIQPLSQKLIQDPSLKR